MVNTKKDKIVENTKKIPKKPTLRTKFNLFVLKFKVPFNKKKAIFKKWHDKKKELQAFEKIVLTIVFDGLLLSLPYWFLIGFNILTIPVFGSVLLVIKRQIVPIITKILGSLCLVRIK